MNIGYEPLTSGYDLSTEQQNLFTLKAGGITCVRIAFYGTNSAITKPLAVLAKTMGFFVSIGNDGDPLSNGYVNGVIAEAQWAQANHIDQVSIGNEAAKNSQTQQSLSSLSCQVRKVFGGIISYDTYLDPSYDEIKAWAQNPGCLSQLGLNIYANYANTAAEAEKLLPGKWYISELDLDCDTGACGSDSNWARGLSTVLTTLQTYKVHRNMFAYVAGGDGVDPHWGMLGHPTVLHVIGL